MKILSVSPGHDANYCIFEDGNVIVHNEVERFTRIKHDCEYSNLVNLIENDPLCNNIDFYVLPIFYTPDNQLGGKYFSDKKYMSIGHHLCHAANVYYDSDFDDAIIFTIDGGGYEEPISYYTSATVSIAKDNKIEMLYKNHIFNLGSVWSNCLSHIFNLGNVYSVVGDQSGTVMAMAAYGNPYKYLKYFDNLGCKHNENLKFPYEELKIIHDSDESAKFNLAASLQYATEQIIKNFIFSHLNIKDNTLKNICFSGGTMLNCVALGKITKQLKSMGYNVFCDKMPNDSGLSVGAAKYYWHNILNNPKIKNSIKNSYYGITYPSELIYRELKNYSNLKIETNVDLNKIVELLMGSKIISVFNEGSESGKRALGNRSIIADPRFSYMKDFINDKVKHRKSFRPFAPSVLREEVSNWFEYDIDSPYMSFAVTVKEDKRHLVPAILHKDNTARLQTVTSKDNGYYYDLIKLFFEKTNVPMLLNTSFNDQEPIVETPKHAISCFFKTKIDYLYFVKEKLLISKIT